MEDKLKNKIEEKMALLTDDDTEFRRSVIMLRKEIGVPEGGFTDELAYNEWADDETNVERFSSVILGLLLGSGLSARYSDAVCEFFCYDRLVVNSAMKYSIYHYPSQQKLYIEVYGDTTESDVQKAYKDIENRKLRERLPEFADRFKPVDIHLMREAYKLRKEGKSYPWIANNLSTDKPLTAEDVRKTIVRYEKLSPKMIVETEQSSEM